MREYDLASSLIKRFKVFIDDMDEVVSDKEPIAQKEEEKLFLKVFNCPGKERNPLAKINILTMEETKVKNKDDKNVLDKTELTAATFIPKDDSPFPLRLLEASFHFEKYFYFAIDLAPLSTDKFYREAFCKPVQDLRKKHEDLPGLLPGAPNPALEDFTSGGMLRGNVDLKYKNTIIEWLFEYVDLYIEFLNEREHYAVLRHPSIIDESKKRKSAFFCQMLKKTVQPAMSDVPNLYSDELCQKLEMQFYLPQY